MQEMRRVESPGCLLVRPASVPTLPQRARPASSSCTSSRGCRRRAGVTLQTMSTPSATPTKLSERQSVTGNGLRPLSERALRTWLLESGLAAERDGNLAATEAGLEAGAALV